MLGPTENPRKDFNSPRSSVGSTMTPQTFLWATSIDIVNFTSTGLWQNYQGSGCIVWPSEDLFPLWGWFIFFSFLDRIGTRGSRKGEVSIDKPSSQRVRHLGKEDKSQMFRLPPCDFLSGCAWDTDRSLCKRRVSLEVHLITLNLDSKSPVPCEGKMFYHKSAESEKVRVTLRN